MFTRRQLLAGMAALPIAIPSTNVLAQPATPQASPVASPLASTAPTTEEILPAWLDAQRALQSLGEAASEAFWSADAESLIAMSTPEVAAGLQAGIDISSLVAGYTQNQIQFAFHEAGAWFFGQYTPEKMSGTFLQGGALQWEAVPGDSQNAEVPTGEWTGVIGPGVVNLGIQLTFTGDAENLEVRLSIPSQLLVNHPMSDVTLHSELPVGELVDQRVIPAGGEVTFVNNYAEQYAWGANTLVLDTWWTGDGLLAGLSLIPQGTLPVVEPQEPIVARLPFDGAWLVVWGGETEFRNYHAVVAPQRHAMDILVWQDGSTANSPGTENESYHAFGQPYIAPVSGQIATVLDGLEDIAPQGAGNPNHHPAGNHIVIEADGGFVFLAHCQQGSILVQEGDDVAAGDVVAAIGNSGNTSEAHVHIHAQTHADLFDPAAAGIPIVFDNALENGEAVELLSPLHGTIVEHRI